MFVPSAENVSSSSVTWKSTTELTPDISHILVRSVVKATQPARISSSTRRSTRERGPILVQSAGSPLHTSPSLPNTIKPTPETGAFAVQIVENASRKITISSSIVRCTAKRNFTHARSARNPSLPAPNSWHIRETMRERNCTFVPS